MLDALHTFDGRRLGVPERRRAVLLLGVGRLAVDLGVEDLTDGTSWFVVPRVLVPVRAQTAIRWSSVALKSSADRA